VGGRSFRRRIKRIRRWCVYYLLRALYGILYFFPRSVLLTVVGVTYCFAYLLDRRDREIMRRNLALAFPDRSRAFRERVARGVFLNLGRGAVDILVAYRNRGRKVEENLPVAVDWKEYCAGAVERGAVVVSGHLGCWELFACSSAQYIPGKLAVLAKRIYFPPLNDWVAGIREAFGLKIFYQDESLKRVVAFLRGKNALGILPDQDIKDVVGIFVPFFGVHAWTPVGPAALAVTARVPMIVSYLVWDGGRYRLETAGPFPLPETGSREKDMRILTETWTRVLEDVIRRYPDQWVWFHRRWRTRPEDVESRPARYRKLNASADK